MRPSKGTVAIAGGTGLIGRNLARELQLAGYDPVILSRSPGTNAEAVQVEYWDAESAATLRPTLEGAQAVINLCGSPVNVRWTERNRRLITDSRVIPTEAIGLAISDCEFPPKVWVNASAVGIYGDSGDLEISEASAPGHGFLAQSCAEWEAAMNPFALPQTRKVVVRIGPVLSVGGGMLPELLKITRAFLGGTVGNGRQYLSWIHILDLARLFEFALELSGFQGVMNATAPHPVTNAMFMEELRRATHRPWVPPAPEGVIRLLAKLKGVEPELLLDGQRVVPQIAVGHGFEFRFSTLRQALNDLLHQHAH